MICLDDTAIARQRAWNDEAEASWTHLTASHSDLFLLSLLLTILGGRVG